MNLTKKEKQFLISKGCTAEDISEMEKVSSKTIYKLYEPKNNKNGKRISFKKVCVYLGNETALLALHRSVFHWTCGRETDEVYISFDSSKYYKK